MHMRTKANDGGEYKKKKKHYQTASCSISWIWKFILKGVRVCVPVVKRERHANILNTYKTINSFK